MGFFRKKVSQTKVEIKDRRSLILRDEAVVLREVEAKVRKQMEAMFSPTWTSQSDRMLQFIYKSCQEHGWFEAWNHISTVVAIRSSLDQIVFPSGLSDQEKLEKATGYLNCDVCFVMTTKLVQEFVRLLPRNTTEVLLTSELRVQVRQDLGDFKGSKRNQHAAFLRSTGQLLFWHDNYQDILDFAIVVEEAVASHLWQTHIKSQDIQDNFHDVSVDGLELETIQNVNRPVQLLLPVMVFCAILVNFGIISLAVRTVVYESIRTGTWARYLIFLYFPLVFFLTSFFSLMLIVTVMNFVGPVAQLFENSKFYSCIPPKRIKKDFPHITVQCPVYKEDLQNVIIPTVQSLRVAISTYERQGGTASIFVNDDGLQLVSPEEKELRKAYYEMNDIGWVARPAHGKNGFVRAGRFKKASNMNFALDISLKIEGLLEHVDRHEKWTDEDEDRAYQQAMEQVLHDKFQATGHMAWAGGNVRVGDLILLIDSDTKVPADCFLDAASEFHWSPQVAILQHQSGVMQVVFDFWENAITYFTQCIYFSLQWATSAGDTAAFVGHNAFLRWSALQEISTYDEDDCMTKWWSESHVSEDFEMSLKLQCKGYVSRYAVYSNEGFQEGVSLTCYDELLRWSKYAYGCSELVFNPFKKWLRKGPFTEIFIKFLRSDLNSFSKFTMVSYIGTYYAIALWPMLIVNFFVVGWYQYFTKQAFVFFNEGFGVFISVLLLFNVVSPISCAASRYRARNSPFWRAVYENFKWSLPLCLFLGSLSMHLSYALIAHMFDLNIQWGATAKTLEAMDFFFELPKIWATFKYIYLTVFLLAILQIYFALFAAPLDRIWGVTSNGPLIWLMIMHTIAPLILNPNAYPSEWTSDLKPYFRACSTWLAKRLGRSRSRPRRRFRNLDQ